MRNETRFRMVEKINPDRFHMLAKQAADHTTRRVAIYQQLAQLTVPHNGQAVVAEEEK
jgi:hypothetical protein